LSSARNQSLETGRPCGVVFRHFSTFPLAMTADQCQSPPSYAGLDENSTLTVSGTVSGTDATVTATGTGNNAFDPALVTIDDSIQFNGQGPLYKITSTATDGVSLTATAGQTPAIPWTTAQTVPYRVFRSPGSYSTKFNSGATPLQLPAATVVDLTYSGYGATTIGATDMSIMFAPNGSVDSVNGASVTQPIFLLVGKRERLLNTAVVGNTDQATLVNYQDLSNLWVVINPQTGLITTGEVAAVLPWNSTNNYAVGACVSYNGNNCYKCIQANKGQTPTTATSYWQSTSAVAAARSLAIDAQSMGGK
jgi:hypothetical protein